MAPPRNFGNHFVTWDDELNKVTVTPQYRNASASIRFGLGDAVIQLNMDHLPPKIVAPITGETTKDGISPTSPFGLKRWFAMPSNITSIPKTITGFNGWTKTIHIPQADGGSVKEVSSTSIKQNGFGSSKIYPRRRVEN